MIDSNHHRGRQLQKETIRECAEVRTIREDGPSKYPTIQGTKKSMTSLCPPAALAVSREKSQGFQISCVHGRMASKQPSNRNRRTAFRFPKWFSYRRFLCPLDSAEVSPAIISCCRHPLRPSRD
ncbi:hypothetical protein KIN20_023261 [Parelaphostrongylus tenuis]|uniref:Uncharacterized protein n=1 Tax=Parelaphostrongylus tenuis TaxID=148309 RepID=A0AAD5QVX8_PARTN|nr:hypothetical protein KIN20_023261 [Parelaphostrongylus tenuis]